MFPLRLIETRYRYSRHNNHRLYASAYAIIARVSRRVARSTTGGICLVAMGCSALAGACDCQFPMKAIPHLLFVRPRVHTRGLYFTFWFTNCKRDTRYPIREHGAVAPLLCAFSDPIIDSCP